MTTIGEGITIDKYSNYHCLNESIKNLQVRGHIKSSDSFLQKTNFFLYHKTRFTSETHQATFQTTIQQSSTSQSCLVQQRKLSWRVSPDRRSKEFKIDEPVAISLLPQYGSYQDVIPLASKLATEEMIRKCKLQYPSFSPDHQLTQENQTSAMTHSTPSNLVISFLKEHEPKSASIAHSAGIPKTCVLLAQLTASRGSGISSCISMPLPCIRNGITSS
jgi:hypothetical protein